MESAEDPVSPSFLRRCLQAAIQESDLVNDIIEACVLSKTSASDLAEWTHEDIATKLFLTPDEANTLITICRASSRGDNGPLVEFEKANQRRAQGDYDPPHFEEDQYPPGVAAGEEASQQEPKQRVEDAEGTEGHTVELPKQVVDVEKPATKASERTETIEQKPTAVSDVHEHSHEKNATRKSKEQQANVHKDTSKMSAISSNNGLASHPVSGSPSSPPRPRKGQGSANASSIQRPVSAHVPSYSRETDEDIAKLPSYLRPTSAYRSRYAKDDQQVQPTSASTAPKRPNFLSRLLTPTAAFVSRVNETRKGGRQGRDSKKAIDDRKSAYHSEVLSSPQGQRITKVEPFLLLTEKVRTDQQLSTEELRYLEGQKAYWRPTDAPKHIFEARPIDGRVRSPSNQKKSEEVFKPFNLASLEKHERYKEMRSRRLKEEAERTEAQRRFHAQQLNKKMLQSPSQKPRPPPPVTQSQEFKLSSEERVKRHKEVLDPARQARLSQQERAKLELKERQTAEQERKEKEAAAAKAAAEAHKAELEKQMNAEYRKSLHFKAKPMPDHRHAFLVDHSKARHPTDPVGFSLSTERRLGSPKRAIEREDAAAPMITDFRSSLRASGSLNGKKKPWGSGSLRASTNSLNMPHHKGSMNGRNSKAMDGSNMMKSMELPRGSHEVTA